MVPRIVPVSTWAKPVVAVTHRHTPAAGMKAPLVRARMPTPFFTAILARWVQSFDRRHGLVKGFFSYGMTVRLALAVLALAAAAGPEAARFVDLAPSAGLTVPTVIGGGRAEQDIIETTGGGGATLGFRHGGWPGRLLVQCSTRVRAAAPPP